MTNAACAGGDRGEFHLSEDFSPDPSAPVQECVSSQLRRRREASRRLPVLDCGRSDPWFYDELALTDRQLDAATATAEHLLAAGLAPLFPVDTVRALWRRDRALTVRLARLRGVA
jgi:hypothetical protein